jgi:hypothetical protein
MSRAAISRVYEIEHSDLLSDYGGESGRHGKIEGRGKDGGGGHGAGMTAVLYVKNL